MKELNKQSSKAFEAAQCLITARNQNQLIELPDSLKPQTLEEGYNIQDHIIQHIDIPQKGWKVAITRDDLMQQAGISEPVSGPLFEMWMHSESHVVTDGSPTLYGIEFEFAFRMAKDLPPKEQSYTPSEVKAAVASLHLAVEPVGTRYTQGPIASGLFQFIADHGGNYGFIHGSAIPNWQEIDLSQVMVTAYLDDQQVAQQLGENVMGDPLNSLTWLANHLPERGYFLKADEWVTTGAVIGPLPVKAPLKAHAIFGELGRIHFDFKG